MTGTDVFDNYLVESTPTMTTAGGIAVIRPRQIKIASTAMLAVTLAFSAPYADTLLLTSYDEQNPSLYANRVNTPSQVDKYIYINQSDVSSFIKTKEITYFLDKLPNIIDEIFGKSQITLSVYQDYEEGWKNLLVSIEPVAVLKNTNKLEKELFARIDKNDTLISALKHVTITCDYKDV